MPAVRFSRYEFANVEVDECGRKFLDVPDPLPRTQFPDDKRFLSGEGDTLWTIAWREYRELLDEGQDLRPSGFWDVLAELNDIFDPLSKLPPGTMVRVPSVEALLNDLKAPPVFLSRNTTL